MVSNRCTRCVKCIFSISVVSTFQAGFFTKNSCLSKLKWIRNDLRDTTRYSSCEERSHSGFKWIDGSIEFRRKYSRFDNLIDTKGRCFFSENFCEFYTKPTIDALICPCCFELSKICLDIIFDGVFSFFIEDFRDLFSLLENFESF